jgi:hypothetical protein
LLQIRWKDIWEGYTLPRVLSDESRSSQLHAFQERFTSNWIDLNAEAAVIIDCKLRAPFIVEMFVRTVLLILYSCLLGWHANAAPTALTAEQWRSDLHQLDNLVREKHPRPFAFVGESEYREAVESLSNDLVHLSDKEIIIRMAEIVAMIKDGHTRLAIPRVDQSVGVSISHSIDPPPSEAELIFSQLPLQFEAFTDGVFITAATTTYQEFIGWRLTHIGDLSATDALEVMKRIAYADNEYFEKLIAVDRLALPDALYALGVVQNAEVIDVTLENSDGEILLLSITPINAPGETWVGPSTGDASPPDTKNHESNLWWQYLRSKRTVYAVIDEIADGNKRFAEFVIEIISEAERRNAKLVIDLRDNFGGAGALNRALILAVLQSPKLNQYGRTFILIGPRTFSAAQMLSNTLETYSRVLFVGEPTGARPDHFGDSSKNQLENSGLTFRVSTLHWSSFFANDSRDALYPDLPAPWTSSAYFNGDDPAIATAAAYDGDLKELVRSAFARNDQYQVGRYLLNARLFPDTADQSVANMLLTISNDFVKDNDTELASLALRYGLFFHPDDVALNEALEKLQENTSEN